MWIHYFYGEVICIAFLVCPPPQQKKNDYRETKLKKISGSEFVSPLASTKRDNVIFILS